MAAQQMFCNRLFLIKVVHTMVFVVISACLVYVLYCGITRTYDWTLLLALGAILTNGLALLLNRMRCPLTTLARRYGDENGAVSDIFLPRWFAGNLFRVASVSFSAELIVLGVRYFTK